jgi:hypothetical protein
VSVLGGIRGQAVKHCRKSDATNRVSPTVTEGQTTFKVRQAIPEIINALKDQLSLVAYRARCKRSQGKQSDGRRDAEEHDMALFDGPPDWRAGAN